MNNYDSLDYQIFYTSTNDNQKSSQFLDQSFDFENESNKDNFNRTQLDNILSPQYDSEIFDSPNIDIVKQNINNIITATPQNLTNNPMLQQESNKKKLLGRKKKNSGEKGVHNKFSEDNIIRKIKPIVNNSLRQFINIKIKECLDLSKINFNGIKHKDIKFLKIKQNQVKDTNVENNKKLLNKKVKDFFNDKRSGNFSSYSENFNGLLIEKLYEIDTDKKVVCILEKTFLECLRYFRMDEDILNDPNYSCLKGLEKSFLELKKKLLKDNDEIYSKKLINSIKNFEAIILKKKGRAKRKHFE